MDLTLLEQKAQNLVYQWYNDLTIEAQDTISSHDMDALQRMLTLFAQEPNNPIFDLPEPLDSDNN